jgi:hypothetical protein
LPQPPLHGFTLKKRWLSSIVLPVSEERGGCLSILMYSHLFLRFAPPLFFTATITVERGFSLEVAVHQNGQTAMRKEVADSNLYECQPPLFPLRASFFTATSPTSSEERGGCLSILMNSHLFHIVPPLSEFYTKHTMGRLCIYG